MSDLIFSLNIVLPLIIFMVLGFLLKKTKSVDEHFLSVSNDMVGKFLLPILLFNSVYKSNLGEFFDLKLLLFVLFTIFTIIIAYVIFLPMFVKDRKKIGAIIQATFRANYLLFGLPVTVSVVGPKGAAIVAFVACIVVPTYNFLAVVILSFYGGEKPKLGKVLISVIQNPLIIASLVGILFAVLKITFPAPVAKVISDISAMTTTFALIVLGGSFKVEHFGVNKVYIFWTILMKFIVLPTIFLGLGYLIGLRGAQLIVIVTLLCSPTAITSYTMARQFNNDFELAAQLLVFTTLLTSGSFFIFLFILRFTKLI